jgi:hypothetical protein
VQSGGFWVRRGKKMAYDADRGLVKANKADLWLENKKLKAALQQAAEIVAKNFCPANYDCPLEEAAFGNGSDTECTQERAERCWMEFWMGDGEVKNER